jgi:putative transcriptional regulator
MIRFHPTNQKLVSFAEGLIPPNEGLLVSAHCDMCAHCRRKVDALIHSCAEQAFSEETEAQIDNALGNMFDAITSRPHTSLERKFTATQKVVSIDGKEFSLPPSLQRVASSIGTWSHLVGKLWQAPVSLGGKNLANFIYMENGGGVPEHTHIGNELTLVIDGTFSDGIHHYDSGDYLSLNQDNTHAPVSDSDDGCLVFSVIDQPLQFTSGWAKLINPLSHLYFKVSTKV